MGDTSWALALSCSTATNIAVAIALLPHKFCKMSKFADCADDTDFTERSARIARVLHWPRRGASEPLKSRVWKQSRSRTGGCEMAVRKIAHDESATTDGNLAAAVCADVLQRLHAD